MRSTETEKESCQWPGIGQLPAGFIGDQGFESQPAEKNADCRAHLDEPAANVKSGAAEREPSQQGQQRIATQREWQAFVHESSLCHAPRLRAESRIIGNASGNYVNMPDIALLYSPQNRARALAAAAALVAIVASVDWVIKPNFSLNFLYLFPIMLAGGFLSRWQIGAMGVCCAVLGELFSPFPQADAATRMAMMSIAFTGTGLFVSELVHKRQLVVEHLQQLTEQEIGRAHV